MNTEQMREALHKIKHEAVSLADAQVIALEALTRATPKSQPSGGEVVWIQPDHLQKARVAPFLCRVSPTQDAPDFVPLTLATHKPEPMTEAEARDLLEAEFLGGPGERNLQDDLRVIRLAESHYGITKPEPRDA